MMNSKRLDTVLIVEDNEDHIAYTQDALNEGDIAHCIIAVRDGQAAIDYLYRQNDFSNPLVSPRPTIILLDLRLPKIDGFGIIERVKSDPELRRIPIILLTSSIDLKDVRRAAELGINDFISKPIECEIFRKKVIALGIYWSRVSDLTW
jgi:two-component system response regulator